MSKLPMKKVTGTDRALPRRPDDWDDDDCCCHGAPEEKRWHLQAWVHNEKTKKWRWKNAMYFHVDCPIHGVTIKTEDAPCHAA